MIPSTPIAMPSTIRSTTTEASAPLRLRLGRWSRDTIRAGEPASQVGRPAAYRAEGESGVLLARLHLFATARTARHDRFCKMWPRGVQPARIPDNREPED